MVEGNYVRLMLRSEQGGTVDVRVIDAPLENSIAGQLVDEYGDVIMASFVVSLDDVLTTQKLGAFQGKLIPLGEPHRPRRFKGKLEPQPSLLDELGEVERTI